MIVPRRTSRRSAGFVSHAFMQLVAIFLGLALLSGLVFGPWPLRIGILVVVAGFGLWLFWTSRQQAAWMRMNPGQRVRVVLGHHAGALGTVVEPHASHQCIRVVLDAGEPFEFTRWELEKIGKEPAA